MNSHPSETHLYSDASYNQRSGSAVLGFLFFTSRDQHETLTPSQAEQSYFQIQEAGNIRAEIRSAILALKSVSIVHGQMVYLYTDCAAIVGLIRRRDKLERAKFVSKAKKQELTNAELYREFYAVYDRVLPQLVQVEGHTSSKGRSRVEKHFAYLDREVRKRLRQFESNLRMQKS